MAAKDLGSKFTCFKCGAKFYDLKRPDPLCPKCGADQRETPVRAPEKPERKRAARAVVEEPEAAPEEVDEDVAGEDVAGEDAEAEPEEAAEEEDERDF